MRPEPPDGLFRPHPWLDGGHRQTLLGFWLRRRLLWPLPAEDLVVEAEPGVRLLLRASWQPGPRARHPALVLVHGLRGAARPAPRGLLAVLSPLAPLVERLAVVGFSLGANLALLALGRRRDQLPAALGAAAAVSPPLHPAACADALGRPANRLYQHYFLRKLVDAYRERQKSRPDLFEAGRGRGVGPPGGHVGFVSRAAASGSFWAPERVLAFLEGGA